MSLFQKARTLKGTYIPTIMGTYFLINMMFSGQFIYFSYFLNGKGLTTQEIGIVMGVPIFISVAGQYFWNNLADRIGINKVHLIIFCSAVCVLPLFLISGSFVPLLITTVLYNIFSTSVLSMFDTQVLYYTTEKGYDFGTMMIPGSFGYLSCVFCLGFIVERNVNYLIVWQIVWGVLALLTLPRCPKVQLPKMKKAAFNPMVMLKKPSVLAALLIACAIQFVYGASTYYFSLYLTQEIGVPSYFIGVCCISAVTVEMAFLAIGDKLVRRFNTKTLLIGIALLLTLRLFVLFCTDSLLLIWLANSIDGISTVATYFFMVTYFKRVAPPEGKASAQAMVSILCNSAARAFGTLYAPAMLMAAGSYQNAYCLIAAIILSFTIIFAIIPVRFIQESEA